MDDETRKLTAELGFSPVVPPKSSWTESWEYDKYLYEKRNKVEGRFRRIFNSFDELDVHWVYCLCPDCDRYQIVLTVSKPMLAPSGTAAISSAV